LRVVLFVCGIVFVCDELLVFVHIVDEEDEGVEVAHHVVVCHEVFVVDQVFVGVFIGVVWLVQEFVTEDGVVLPVLVLLVLLIGVVLHDEEVAEEITDEDAIQEVIPVFVLLVLLVEVVVHGEIIEVEPVFVDH
jgi:hypothetical protein